MVFFYYWAFATVFLLNFTSTYSATATLAEIATNAFGISNTIATSIVATNSANPNANATISVDAASAIPK